MCEVTVYWCFMSDVFPQVFPNFFTLQLAVLCLWLNVIIKFSQIKLCDYLYTTFVNIYNTTDKRCFL